MASAEEKRRCRTVPDRFPSANNQHMVLGRKGMTTPVRIQQSIRQLETKGLTHTQIARELGVSRTTVVKYATRDYSPVPPTGGTASRSLVAGEYARKADEWLEADRRMPRKQRHTPGAYTSGSWRNAASRAVIRRCSDGSSAGANAIAPYARTGPHQRHHSIAWLEANPTDRFPQPLSPQPRSCSHPWRICRIPRLGPRPAISTASKPVSS